MKLLPTELDFLEQQLPYFHPSAFLAIKQNTVFHTPQPEAWRLRRGANQSQGEWYSRGYLPHRDGTALIQHVTVHLADSLPQSAVERMELSIKLLPEAQRRNERRHKLHELIDAGHGSCILRIPAVADMVQDTLLFFHEKRYYLHAWVVMPNHFHVLFEPIESWSMAKIVSSWKKYTARRIRDYLRNNGEGIGSAVDFGTEANLQERLICKGVEGLTNANQEIGVPHMADSLEAIVTPVDQEASVLDNDSKRAALKPVWHREFWDRYIRDEEHYQDTVDYIHNNPVKAGLVRSPEAWPWSSAGRGEGEEGMSQSNT